MSVRAAIRQMIPFTKESEILGESVEHLVGQKTLEGLRPMRTGVWTPLT